MGRPEIVVYTGARRAFSTGDAGVPAPAACGESSLTVLIGIPVSPSTQQLFGDGLQLQVRRAFVNLADLRVAPEFLDRIVLDVAVAAQEVDRQRGDALGHLR